MLVLSLLTGLLYPALITVLAQFFFPWQANGSLLEKNKKVIGSELIAQKFNEDIYFLSRSALESASGVDPHISLEMALNQITRVAKKRKISEATILELVRAVLKKNKLINVLDLNLKLDELKS